MGKSLNISLVATLTPLQKSLELVGKMMSDFAKSIETTDKKLSDSIKNSVAQMNTELSKVQSSFDGLGKAGNEAGVKGGKGMKSLKTQIREATLEAQRAAEQFGEFSPEFIEAAQRAADLRDKFGDMQQVIDSLNPDAKMKAFGGVVKGVLGGFQAAEGAMAAFGIESENAQKTMAKLQGLMALSSGINELGALADSMKAFKISILANIPALNTLKGAMAATGIGLIIVAVAALAMNWDSVTEALDGAAIAAEKAKDKQIAAAKAFEEQVEAGQKVIDENFAKQTKYINQTADWKIKQAEHEKALAEASGASAKIIYDAEVKVLNLQKEKAQRIAEFSSKNDSYMKQEFEAKERIKDIDAEIAVATAAFRKKEAEDRAKAMADLKKENTETEAQYNERIEFTLSAQKRIKKASEIKPSAAPNATTDIAMPKMAGKQIVIGGSDRKTLDDELNWRSKMYLNYYKKIEKMSDSAAKKSGEYSAALNKSISDMTAKSLTLLGDSIAQMFTGDFSAKNFLNSMLLIVADFATQLGTAFIGIAASTDAFKVALGGLPGVAIAIGVGLVAVGGAIKAGVAKMSEKPKASYAIGSRYIPYDMTAQIHKGEMIIPASENPYANSGGRVMPSVGGGVLALSTTLRGSDIRISADKTTRTYNRITGRG